MNQEIKSKLCELSQKYCDEIYKILHEFPISNPDLIRCNGDFVFVNNLIFQAISDSLLMTNINYLDDKEKKLAYLKELRDFWDWQIKRLHLSVEDK
jgi:hypothetical protein